MVLTEHQEEIIERLVRSGRYQDASEIVREGLRLLEQREEENVARLEALRQAAQRGAEAFERGEYRQFDSLDDLERYLTERSEPTITRSRTR